MPALIILYNSSTLVKNSFAFVVGGEGGGIMLGQLFKKIIQFTGRLDQGANLKSVLQPAIQASCS